MLCKCSNQFRFDHEHEDGPSLASSFSRELSAKLREGEAKLQEGSIREAELSLREALSVNNEEARALLGRLEYNRGNYEAALNVLEGIQGHNFGASLQVFVADAKKKGTQSKDGSGGKDGVLGTFLHGASLLLEALYLKAKCLQKLDRILDATRECTRVLDTMESAIPAGLPDGWGCTRLAEQLSRAVLLLPTLLLQSNHTSDALLAYRRSLLRFSWCLASHDLVHIMKTFAVLLLYAGVEAPRTTLPPAHVENAFTPKNNTEEGILLLMILLRIMNKQQGYFDATVFEHLTFALSINGELETLAHQYEALLPGTLTRPARWYSLALCYSGSHPSRALSLLRKSLAPTERPNDVPALLLASKLCVATPGLSTESLNYANRALHHMVTTSSTALKARALHIRGVALRSQAIQLPSASSSGSRSGSRDLRTALHDEARDALQEAVSLEGGDTAMVFDLGLVMAEMREWGWAVECGTRCLDFGGGGGTEGRVQGWRLLALALSAQERHGEADVVLESALEETAPREQGLLLRTRARVLLALGEPVRAVRSYQVLLGVLQAEESWRVAGAGGVVVGKVRPALTYSQPYRIRRSTEAALTVDYCTSEAPLTMPIQVEQRVEEAEVWHDLAQVYTQLEQWQDAEICLEKARSFDSYSVATWHNSGLLHEEQGQLEDAILCYKSALAIDATYIDSKVKLGSLLWQVQGPSAFPAAKSYLNEALEADPTHVDAWYHMGMLQKAVGQKHEAAKSFHAAVVQEQFSLVEKLTSITPALLW